MNKQMENSGKAILDWRKTFAPNFVSGYRLPRFVEESWLKEITGRKRDRIYAFEPYLEAFKE